MAYAQPDPTRTALRNWARTARAVCDQLAEMASQEETEQVETGIRLLVRRALSRSG